MMHMSECVFYMHSSLWLSRVNCLTETQLNIKWDVSGWYSDGNYCPLKNWNAIIIVMVPNVWCKFFLKCFHIAHIFSFWFIFGYSSVIRSSHFVTLVLVLRSWIIIVFLVRTVFDYFCCYCGLQIFRSLIFAETGSRSQKQRRPSPALLKRQFRGHRAKLGVVASHRLLVMTMMMMMMMAMMMLVMTMMMIDDLVDTEAAPSLLPDMIRSSIIWEF